MDIGTDTDGRSITYDKETDAFSIGGIATAIDRIVAYDRGKQINWASDKTRDWATQYLEYRQALAAREDVIRANAQAHEAARQAEVARRLRLTAQGYDSGSIVRFSGMLKGLGVTLLVILTISGVLEGVVAGVVFARRSAAGLIILPLLFGGTGFLLGYLARLIMKAAADLLLAVVQIEMNTRPQE